MRTALPAADDWTALSVEAPPAGSEVYLVEALRRLGARAIERDGPRYLALLPPAAVSPDLLPEARAAIRAATGIPAPDVRLERIPHDEWAGRWNACLRPLPVGRRFLIVPEGWKGDRTPEGDAARIVIRLTAGMAFGTAEHPTTRDCLALLEELIVPDARLLDLGAGSGILSLGAAALGADPVLALEMDPDACRIARRNAEINGLTDRIEVRSAEVRAANAHRGAGAPELIAVDPAAPEPDPSPDPPSRPSPDPPSRPSPDPPSPPPSPPPPDHSLRLPLAASTFDGVVANLEAPTLGPLIPGIATLPGSGGWVVLSGVPAHEAPSIVERASASNLTEVARRIEEGWWTGAFRRSLTPDLPLSP